MKISSKNALCAAPLFTALFCAWGNPVHAQTGPNVTVYGLLDGGVVHTKFKNRNANNTNPPANASSFGFLSGGQSGNRWGLRGSEDLGAGLQAVFRLENGFNLGRGTAAQGSRLFGREASVGLKSDRVGQLTFGRQPTLAHRWFADIVSPFGNGFNQANASGTFAVAQGRLDNQVQYQSPNKAGVQVGVGYSFNASGASGFKTTSGNPNVRAWTAGVRYADGPAQAMLSYESHQNRNDAPPTPTHLAGVKVQSWHLAANYDFKVIKLYLGLGLTRHGWFDNLSNMSNAQINIGQISLYNRGFRAYSYGLALSAPLGASDRILAGWGMVDPDRNGTQYPAAQKLKAQQTYSMAWTHELSKRTNVYVVSTYGDNLALMRGDKTRSIGTGLRHRF